MLLICPNCGARYHVPPGVWPAEPSSSENRTPRPRKVRCKMCQNIWIATPTLTEPEDSAADMVLAEPDPAEQESFEEPIYEAPQPQPDRSPVWLWVAGVIVVATLGGGVYLGKDHLQEVEFPAISMPEITLPKIELPKLDLSWMRLPGRPASLLSIDVEHEAGALPNGQPIWQVQGVVHNDTSSISPMPPIELQMLDDKGAVVGRWTVRPDIENLAPGEEWAFETTRINPPASARHIRAEAKPPALARP